MSTKKNVSLFGRFNRNDYFCKINKKELLFMPATRFLILILMTLLTATAQAVVPDLKFSRLDTRDGLSNSQMTCILRDSKGFVWAGTPYGLNRYDGYRVKIFYSDMRDSTTLRSNSIDAIFEAFDGKLWLKQGMGYCVFDPVTERCDRHPERWLEEQGITGGVESVYIDSKKDFWVKSVSNGFWHYSPQTKKIKNYPFGYGPQEFNQEASVSSMTESDNLVILASNNGEIICFDRDRDVITRKDDYLFSHGLTRDQDCKIRIDNDGNYWVITQPISYIWERKTGQWIHSAPTALKSWGYTEAPDEMAVWDICEDTKKRLWIATDHGGLYVTDPRDKEIKQFLSNKYDESSISDNTLRYLYRDQMGRIWIGTYMNGINLNVGAVSTFRNLELGNVNTICHDRYGYSWLGTNDAGIIRFNINTGEQVVYNKENSGIGSNTMVGSLAASDGSVWFGTFEGGLIHIKNGHITNYKATGDSTGLANNNVWTVCEDQWGNIWIGTLGGGVQRIDRQTGRMRTFDMSNTILPSNYISTITRTKKGWLMVAHSKYYSLINPKTFRIVNRDFNDNHNEIATTEMSIMGMEDSRGLAWQGSSSGATIWDPKTKELYLIDIKSGLYGSTVNGIIEDKKHTMWVVTDHGISNIIAQRQDNGRYSFIVRSYNNRDGLQVGPYNQRSICYTKQGLILVGGHGGLDILNPDNLLKDRQQEMPVFDGLMVDERDVVVGEEVNGRVILEQALNYCSHVKLRYGEQFTVQLATNSGEIHNRSRFVYKLEGINENWVKTSELNPNINFMSLRYGDYTLRLRMLNDDGTIGDNEAVLDITVAAPLWRARWALLIYALAIMVVAWFWRRYFMRRQAERLEIEHMRRELEKKQWMSEMRTQMEKEGLLVKAPERPKEQLIFHPTTNELVGFVKHTVESFRIPNNKPIKLAFISSLNRLTMPFDPALLTRMFDILLTNASKFSVSGTKIKVSVSEKNNQAELRVADRGVGIPDEARAHMFDAAVDPGLQLDIVKDIVNLHGGTVRGDNNPEGGTIFIILLPIDAKMETEDDIIEDAVLMDD